MIRKRRHVLGGKGGRGFTLIELLTVIGIIGMLFALSVPALMSMFRGQRLKNCGNYVQMMLNQAKQMTLSRRVHHRVVFFADRMVIWRDVQQKAGTGRRSAKGKKGGGSEWLERGFVLDNPKPLEFDKGVVYILGYKGKHNFVPPKWEDDKKVIRQRANNREFIFNYSVGFKYDGSMDFGGFNSVSREDIGRKGDVDTDPVPPRNADLIFRLPMKRDWAWVDIDPAGGKVSYHITRRGGDYEDRGENGF